MTILFYDVLPHFIIRHDANSIAHMIVQQGMKVLNLKLTGMLAVCLQVMIFDLVNLEPCPNILMPCHCQVQPAAKS